MGFTSTITTGVNPLNRDNKLVEPRGSHKWEAASQAISILTALGIGAAITYVRRAPDQVFSAAQLIKSGAQAGLPVYAAIQGVRHLIRSSHEAPTSTGGNDATLKQEIKDLKAAAETAKTTLATAKQEATDAAASLLLATEAKVAAEVDLVDSQTDLTRAKTDLTAAQAQVTALGKKNPGGVKNAGEIAKLTTEVNAQKDKVTAAEKKAGLAEQALATAKTQHTARLQEANTAKEELQGDLDKVRQRHDEATKILTAQLTAAKTAKKAVEGQLATALTAAHDTKGKVTALLDRAKASEEKATQLQEGNKKSSEEVQKQLNDLKAELANAKADVKAKEALLATAEEVNLGPVEQMAGLKSEPKKVEEKILIDDDEPLIPNNSKLFKSPSLLKASSASSATATRTTVTSEKGSGDDEKNVESSPKEKTEKKTSEKSEKSEGDNNKLSYLDAAKKKDEEKVESSSKEEKTGESVTDVKSEGGPRRSPRNEDKQKKD